MTHLLQIPILNSILVPACSMLGAAFQALLCPIHSSSIFLLLSFPIWLLDIRERLWSPFDQIEREREQLHLNFGSYFPPNSWKGEDSAAWFWTVSFAWALSLMSTVTACDKMADSICDRPDHKYTTQLQWFTITTGKSTFSSWSEKKFSITNAKF